MKKRNPLGAPADAVPASQDVAAPDAEDSASGTGSNQDLFERAKARIDDYKEVMREQHRRMREDLRFSNPAKPEQWDPQTVRSRGKRPTLTLDRTNQFILQVANDMRQNNAGIEVIAADGDADTKVAETLESMVRHIEYRARAAIAYDTAGDLQVRVGLGWLRAGVCAGDNGDEIDIMRVTDPTSCGIDLDCLEPDGHGAKWGFAEAKMHRKTFEQRYPAASEVPIGMEGWAEGDYIVYVDYYEIDEETGEQTWTQLTGASIIEDPIPFPCSMIPIVPVVGYELEVDGKRYLCGLTRRLMDGQKLHNYEMSAIAEFLATQPKAPVMGAAESIAGYEDYWKGLANGNPSYLPYKALDPQGRPLPPPQRVLPPPMPGAYATMAQFATEEMQASVGMYKANLGQQGNETAGVAIRARQMEGDVATLQFPDNHGKSQAQLGRIVVDMIPRIYTEKRIERIVGVDGQASFVTINPSMRSPLKRDRSGKVTAINPSLGKYDAVVKSGPSYTTAREETFDQLSQIMSQQPTLAPVLGPMWARLKDMPQSDMLAKLFLAVAPPQVQQVYGEGEDMPPHVAAQMQQLQGQLQAANDAMQGAAQQIAQLRQQAQDTRFKALADAAQARIDQYNAETNRLKVVGAGMTEPQVQAVVMQLLPQLLSEMGLGAQGAPAGMPPPVPTLPPGVPQGAPLLPTGMQPVEPPGPAPFPSPGAMPPHPLAHRTPPTSNEPPPGGSFVSGSPL